MKYLSSEPFSSGPSNKAYRDGWDRIFGKREEPKVYFCIWCGRTFPPEAAKTHPAYCPPQLKAKPGE
jgi:hypothetical protein